MPHLGIRLRADGDAMRYSAPKGAMTSELAAALKAHKPAIMETLTRTTLTAAALAGRRPYLPGVACLHRGTQGLEHRA